jgi:hypothetical protein
MSDCLPMEVSESIPSSAIDSQLDALLGEVFRVGDKKYRLVQADAALSSPGGKLVAYHTTAGDAAARLVQFQASGTGVINGVVDINMGDIAADDYFLVQIEGRCEVIAGEAIAEGNFIIGGTGGKAHDGGTTATPYVDALRAVDAASTDGDQITADIMGTLS